MLPIVLRRFIMKITYTAAALPCTGGHGVTLLGRIYPSACFCVRSFSARGMVVFAFRDVERESLGQVVDLYNACKPECLELYREGIFRSVVRVSSGEMSTSFNADRHVKMERRHDANANAAVTGLLSLLIMCTLCSTCPTKNCNWTDSVGPTTPSFAADALECPSFNHTLSTSSHSAQRHQHQ